ncbi:hypothetical protein BH11ACT8_BH11ACT8_05560 [soil metagenome]
MKRIPAVLVLGVLVLASPTITGCEDDAATDSAGATTTPAAASTPSATPTPADPTPTDPTPTGAADPVLDLAGLPQGPPPALVYGVDPHPTFLDGHFRLVDRGAIDQPLRRGPLGPFVWYDDGRAVTSYGTEAGVAVEVLGPDGEVAESTVGLAGYGLAATPDASIVGWLEDDGTVTVLEDGARRTLSLPAVTGGDHLGAILGSGTCQEDYPEGGGCTAFVNSAPGAERPRAWLTTSHGIVDVVPHLTEVRDAADDGSLVGRLSGHGDDPGCSGVLTPRGRVSWRTCERRLIDLSSDGDHVIGVVGDPAYGLVRAVTVYDRSGDAVASWSVPGGRSSRIESLAWEGDDAVLAVVHDRGAWSVVRLLLDGTAEYAVGPIDLAPDFSPYQLPIT